MQFHQSLEAGGNGVPSTEGCTATNGEYPTQSGARAFSHPQVGIDDLLTSPRVNFTALSNRSELKLHGIFNYTFDLPGHDITLRQLDDIIEEFRKACYATGKLVDQPHLREIARKAIQALSPFYSERDADRLLGRALNRSLRGVSRKLRTP